MFLLCEKRLMGYFNSGSHCISDIKIRALCPISGSNNSRKRQEMRIGINERFSFIQCDLSLSDFLRHRQA